MNGFNPKKYIENISKELFKNAQGKKLVAVSGGVDSSVSASLLIRAGLDVKLLFINTGFMRENEEREVFDSFSKAKFKVKSIDASRKFYSGLKDKILSKDKREEFRKIYFEVLLDYASKNKITSIVQGTQFHNGTAKVYHNCPTDKFLKSGIKNIEPVRGLKKDEIRLLAKELDLPKEIVRRRAFPGPGLLIRFGGKFSKEKLNLIRKATNIVDKFVAENPKDFKNCYQIFPYLSLDNTATFVDKYGQGNYGYILILRAISVKKVDKSLVYEPFVIRQSLLNELVKLIMKKLPIARVCFDITSKYGFGDKVKSGGTIEYA